MREARRTSQADRGRPTLALGIASASRWRQRVGNRKPVLRQERGNDEGAATGRTNELEGDATLHEQGDQRSRLRRRLGQELGQDVQGDIVRVDLGVGGHGQTEGLQELKEEEGHPQLLEDEGGHGTPPQVQPTDALEGLESSLNIPAARIEAYDLGEGELLRVEHVSEVLMQVATAPKLDQAHQRGGAVGPMGAQPDEGIKGLAVLRQDALDVKGGALAQTRDPGVALLAQIIKPSKTEIAQVSQDETASR